MPIIWICSFLYYAVQIYCTIFKYSKYIAAVTSTILQETKPGDWLIDQSIHSTLSSISRQQMLKMLFEKIHQLEVKLYNYMI